MEVRDSLKKAMKDAMIAKDKVRLGVIRFIIDEINKAELAKEEASFKKARKAGDIENATLEPFTANDVLNCLSTMIKNRETSMSTYKEAGRDDLAEKEEYEIGVIREFMPAPLQEDEIKKMVTAAIAELGASEMRDIGKVFRISKLML